MTPATIRSYCLSKPGTDEDLPFDQETVALRVLGYMFCLIANSPSAVNMNLKCDPERAQQLRAAHPEIIPGYHMNKKHWNTVRIDGALTDELLRELIDHSYACVVAKFSRKDRQLLEAQSLSGPNQAAQADTTGSF